MIAENLRSAAASAGLGLGRLFLFFRLGLNRNDGFTAYRAEKPFILEHGVAHYTAALY